MAYIKTKKGRTSTYRFTIDSLDDIDYINLKESSRVNNKSVSNMNNYIRQSGSSRPFYDREYVWARPRGPRGKNEYDTPKENATHYDVYVMTQKVWN